jgi:cyclohexyl-isocyanide hydratase
MIQPDTQLQIGSLLFGGLDQGELIGPFEVLSRSQLDLSPLR